MSESEMPALPHAAIRWVKPHVIAWIHAFPLDGRMWGPLIQKLPGYQHLVIDLPGFGAGDDPPDGPLTMEAIAERVAHALTDGGVEQAIIGGCSMGGYAALAFAKEHPDRVLALVLSDTRAEPDDAAGQEKREAFAQTVLAEGSAAAEQALLPKLLARQEGRARDLASRMILEARPAGIAAALRGMAVRRDAGAWLQEIAAPTLALVGELDGLTPPANSKRLAFEIPHAELCVIPGVGHLAPLEAPGRCARAINGFLHRALDEQIRD